MDGVKVDMTTQYTAGWRKWEIFWAYEVGIPDFIPTLGMC